eukprot:TRINITY_DN273_c1_g1_i1.p3 TRINITY_DN273_c1_g1~~TRINITY_DN273_c1_g1_i1.p3  ORF type:complete len:118 (+),score=3.13 TRINITY_DN273_c1_g1_i1:237-590(+)
MGSDESSSSDYSSTDSSSSQSVKRPRKKEAPAVFSRAKTEPIPNHPVIPVENPIPANPKKRKITPEELSKHDSPASVWLSANGRVYDATAFLESHPGGGKQVNLAIFDLFFDVFWRF